MSAQILHWKSHRVTSWCNKICPIVTVHPMWMLRIGVLVLKWGPDAFGFLPEWLDPSWRGRRWRSRTGRSTPGVSRGWSATRDLRRRACPEQNPTTESIGRRLIRSGWESPFRWTIRWGLPCWVWKEDDITCIKIYLMTFRAGYQRNWLNQTMKYL